MPFLNRLLLATDGSAYAQAAAEYGAPFAERFGAEVVVLNVTAAVDERARQAVERAATPFEERKLDVQLMVEKAGDPVDAICGFARRTATAVIALGSSGEGGLKRKLLGSVCTGIVKKAPCHVLAVRNPSEALKILVPVDDSEPAKLAAVAAGEVAKVFGTGVTLLHVATSDRGAVAGAALLDRMKMMLAMTGVPTGTRLDRGKPAEQVLSVARYGHYTLVVIGAWGSGGLKALGSVAERMANEAPCPVLVIKNPPGA